MKLAHLPYKGTVMVNMPDDPNEEAQVRAAFDNMPIIQHAMVITGFKGRNVHGSSVLEAVRLIDGVSKQYPTATFDVPTIAALLGGDVHTDREEIEAYKALLPDYNGSLATKLRAHGEGLSLTFAFTFKKSGVHYQVVFSGEKNLTFPVTANVVVYSDMDDMENHGDECPQRLDESDPDYSDDCHCESEVVNNATFTIKESADVDKFKGWIESEIFKVSADE